MNRQAYLILRLTTLAGATFLLVTGSIPLGIVLAVVFVFLILKTPAADAAGSTAAPALRRIATGPAPIAPETTSRPVANATIPGVAELYGRLPKA